MNTKSPGKERDRMNATATDGRTCPRAGARYIAAAAVLGALWFTAAVPAQNASIDMEKLRGAISEQAAASPDSPAATASGVTAAPKRENVVMVTLRIAGYLVLLLAIIVGAAWGMRRLGLAGRARAGGSMDILEILPLGQNRALVLARVADKVYLLGQSPESIEKLETYEGQKALELISATRGIVSMSQFKEVFGSFMSRFSKQQAP